MASGYQFHRKLTQKVIRPKSSISFQNRQDALTFYFHSPPSPSLKRVLPDFLQRVPKKESTQRTWSLLNPGCRIQKKIECIRSLKAPLRMLPAEALLEIFFWCIILYLFCWILNSSSARRKIISVTQFHSGIAALCTERWKSLLIH